VDTHLEPQIRQIGVVNLGNSPATTCDSRLDVTNLGFNLLRPELIEVPLNKYQDIGGRGRMSKLGRFLGCVLILQSVINSVSVAEEATTNVLANSQQTFVKRHTLKELRDQYIVKQQLDYSCGAAALATLMIYYFGEKTSEQEILDLLSVRLKNITKEEVARKKRVGFSLLDLKQVAQQKGYKAAGFRLTLEQLRQLTAPVIVYVHPLGYHHFAVLRGVAGDRVFLADPGRGNLSMSVARFADEYGGIVFVLGKAGEENITTYPLALSRPNDYVGPDQRRVIYRMNDFAAYTTDLALRSLPPSPR
jgi:predicted double-glycine peptidase